MAESPRERRVANELAMLRRMVDLNADRLQLREVTPDGAVVRFETPAHGAQVHELRIVFAPYFPSVPIEAYLAAPVRHPNVHPVSGFICLWDQHSAGDTVVETLRQVQRVLSGELWNARADHLMQPDEVGLAALPYAPLALPEDYLLEREARAYGTRAMRVRLTEVG